MDFDKCYDLVLDEFSQGKYRDELGYAKEEFFIQSGVVHEDNSLYEERINAFLDWYLFERQLIDEDLPPVILYYKRHKDEFSAEEEEVFRGFTETVHALFLVKNTENKKIFLKDLFTNKKYMVFDSYVEPILNKGDIFESRLIPFKGCYIFSRGFCFHPSETKSYILSEIKKIRNMGTEQHTAFMMRLALMRLKVEEYPHVDIKDIYNHSPLINF